ncbi:hypothetical protein EVAR_75600_1 [Eumeta japonica]|uniref:Uncharacterized protein n=1 Tax=Eumeta variegata TaxID=151549 RepID=A0A4C1U0A6_EUMVA|nr:hypothetical protein EVAR_75600_1 [Eumeta japonica]
MFIGGWITSSPAIRMILKSFEISLKNLGRVVTHTPHLGKYLQPSISDTVIWRTEGNVKVSIVGDTVAAGQVRPRRWSSLESEMPISRFGQLSSEIGDTSCPARTQRQAFDG